MGSCRDISVSYLKNFGYSVVRHPNGEIAPLGLIGVQRGEPSYLGPLNLLITNPPGPLPSIARDTVAADINGKKSSSLKIGLGVSILGNIVGALGGNIGVNLSYTNARRIEFSFSDVLNDSVVPLEVGNYLRAADVDKGNVILKEYVEGNGKLYLITKTAKSNKITVAYERSSGVGASIEVPVLQEIAGGKVTVDTTHAAEGKVTFAGSQNLVFAFQAFEVGVADGELSLVKARADNVFLSVDEPNGDLPAPLDWDGLTDLRMPPR